jgi:hypothetical protein
LRIAIASMNVTDSSYVASSVPTPNPEPGRPAAMLDGKKATIIRVEIAERR